MYENLAFPLNVYAKILELNQQPVKYLHFGLFDLENPASLDESVYQAQQRSTDKILQFLPEPPASVLEIGIGLGTSQKLLLEKGYLAEGVTPDAAQIEIAKKNIGSHQQLSCCKFEDYSTDKQYDVILTQESAQYIDLIDLIPKSAQLLKDNGYFVLIDEVALQYPNPTVTALHHPEHIRYLAKSCGLILEHEEELGQQAKYTMDYLLKGLNQHWQSILSSISQNEQQLLELKQAIIDYIHKYQNKDYGYHFFVFRKNSLKKHNQLNYFNHQHFEQFQALFLNAFNQNIEYNLWQWKYQQNLSHSIAYWKNNKLVGHYGGFSRDILFFGQPTKALQIGDTMVSRDKRAIFTKNGIFHQLARNFLYRFIGYGSPYPIGFGFPNKRVMRLAEKLGLYHKVGQFTQLDWPKEPINGIKASVLYKIRRITAQDKNAIDKLWQKMAKATSSYIIGQRDWSRFNYRYFQHPKHDYQVYKINNRFNQKLIAIFVLKQEQERTLLVDLICLPKLIKHVIRAAIRMSKQQNGQHLYSLISDNLLALFSHYQCQQSDPGIAIPHSACTTGASVEQIQDKWWLMAGDSDFL